MYHNAEVEGGYNIARRNWSDIFFWRTLRHLKLNISYTRYWKKSTWMNERFCNILVHTILQRLYYVAEAVQAVIGTRCGY